MVELVAGVAVGVLDFGSKGKRGMRLVALAGPVLQESGRLVEVILGVVGELFAGGNMGLYLQYGYTAVIIAVDGLVWARLNYATEKGLGPGSPEEDCPLNIHFEAIFAVAAKCEDVVEGVGVLVVGGTAGGSDILHCSQAVVLYVGGPPQAPSAEAAAEGEQQAPEMMRLES